MFICTINVVQFNSIQEVNQTRTAIESTANKLRTMTNISDMRNRVTDALNRAVDILTRYQPIQFEIRGTESQNGGADKVRNSPPPHSPARGSVTQLGEDVAALLFPGSGTGRLSRQSSHHSTYWSSEPPTYYETREGLTPTGSVTGCQSPTHSLSSRHLDEKAANQAAQRQIYQNCLRLESGVDSLQTKREKRASTD